MLVFVSDCDRCAHHILSFCAFLGDALMSVSASSFGARHSFAKASRGEGVGEGRKTLRRQPSPCSTTNVHNLPSRTPHQVRSSNENPKLPSVRSWPLLLRRRWTPRPPLLVLLPSLVRPRSLSLPFLRLPPPPPPPPPPPAHLVRRLRRQAFPRPTCSASSCPKSA